MIKEHQLFVKSIEIQRKDINKITDSTINNSMHIALSKLIITYCIERYGMNYKFTDTFGEWAWNQLEIY